MALNQKASVKGPTKQLDPELARLQNRFGGLASSNGGVEAGDPSLYSSGPAEEKVAYVAYLKSLTPVALTNMMQERGADNLLLVCFPAHSVADRPARPLVRSDPPACRTLPPDRPDRPPDPSAPPTRPPVRPDRPT